MGKIIQIEVRYGLTINTGNYESQRIDLGAIVDVRSDESTDDAYSVVYEQLKSKAKALTGY